MKIITLFIVGLIMLTGSTLLFASGQADLILYNGKVITVDAADHICQAVAIEGDKILAVGTDPEIMALAGPQCQLINLQGKTVTPGLIDSHYHMMYYGAQFWPGYLDIRYPVTTSRADVLQVVGNRASQLNPGEWISADQGFSLQAFETLDRWALDSVAPNNPVYLRHSSGQYSVVNSMALDIAGIDTSTPNPPGALILRDEHGVPTGVLSHYPAENLVGRYATGYGDRTDEEKFDDIERGQNLCLQAGYTSIQDVIVGSMRDINLYRQYADSGRLKVRLYALLYLDTEHQADSLSKIVQPVDTGMFKFAGWKLAMDGGVAARTLLMYDKSLYASEISYPYHTQDELNNIIQILHNTGLQVAVHVSGDEGIDMTLTAFEAAMAANPRPDPRHRIEHGLFPSAAAVQRMKADNIILSTQPQWITWYSEGFKTATDDATMSRFLQLKTMLDSGIHIAFGCDVPASIYQEPKWAFHGSTLRRSGSSGNVFNPDQILTMPQALRIHTMGSAYAGFADSTTGSLEPGKYADLVIWSHDLYTMIPNQLINLAAEMTIVGGNIAYDNGENTVVSIASDRQDIPESYQLSQNYPNPFNPTTTITFYIPTSSHVTLAVYDLLGREVKMLVNGEMKPGNYKVTFDGTNLASGVYVYRLGAGKFIQTRKLLLLK